MSRFRPCIDLHDGRVKQIVGGTLRDEESGVLPQGTASPNRGTDQGVTDQRRSTAQNGPTVQKGPTENFVADQPPGWFAKQYQRDNLTGGHVIKLGPGNDAAAEEALAAYPGGLQIGGGITPDNAGRWIDAGASHVIVTSWLFDPSGEFDESKLDAMVSAVGKDRLVIDLSCRQTNPRHGHETWHVASNRWQTITTLEVTESVLDRISHRCDEFLIHAADVEGKCRGIDQALVNLLGRWGGCPMVYAGGIASWDDIEAIRSSSDGRLDYTVGSALDLFGGTAIRYSDLVESF